MPRMTPDWTKAANTNAFGYVAKGTLGNMVEVWEWKWVEGELKERFCCWLPSEDAIAHTSTSGAWAELEDPERIVARYVEAKELGLVA